MTGNGNDNFIHPEKRLCQTMNSAALFNFNGETGPIALQVHPENPVEGQRSLFQTSFLIQERSKSQGLFKYWKARWKNVMRRWQA
jgi:hypothetical protein